MYSISQLAQASLQASGMGGVWGVVAESRSDVIKGNKPFFRTVHKLLSNSFVSAPSDVELYDMTYPYTGRHTQPSAWRDKTWRSISWRCNWRRCEIWFIFMHRPRSCLRALVKLLQFLWCAHLDNRNFQVPPDLVVWRLRVSYVEVPQSQHTYILTAPNATLPFIFSD